MGQGQSSHDGGDEGNAPLKQDYYELLGVERTASDDEIKKAYRRRALELHPDRNFGKTDDATRLFAEVQSAYEILSDPQERAWYDSHRDVLLRGDGAGADGEEYSYNIRITTTEEVLGLMMKFNKRMDYSDSPSGFYGGLNDFFKKIAKEEDVACQWQDLEYLDYPDFGSKEDSYEDVVRPFYGAWTGFATKKSYSWKDKYRLSDAPDRRIRRLMEKENQKIRDDAIQEFNDAIRSLVAFVRKRDERVQNNQKSEAERQKALRDLAAAQAARARTQRQQELEQLDNAAVPEWSRSRATDEHEGGFSSESDVEEHEYECVVCDKVFKSEAQLSMHEKSKKHLKLLKELKRDMRKEGQNLDMKSEQNSHEQERGSDVDEKDAEHSTENQAEPIQNGNTASSEDEAAPKTKTAPVPAISASDNELSDSQDDEYASREAVEERLAGKSEFEAMQKIRDLQMEETPTTSDADSGFLPKVGKAKLKRAKKAAQKASETDTGRSTSEFQCAVCKAEFASKTKLFTHIKEKDHAAPLSQMKGSGSKGGKGKKR